MNPIAAIGTMTIHIVLIACVYACMISPRSGSYMSPSTHRQYTSITYVAPPRIKTGKGDWEARYIKKEETHLNIRQLPHTLTQTRRARIEPRIRRARYLCDFMAQNRRVDGLAERDTDRAAEGSKSDDIVRCNQKID